MSDDAVHGEIQQFMEGLRKRNPHELEFHQAVHEVVESLMPYVLAHPEYVEANILERMVTKARYWGESVGARYGEPLLHVGPLSLDDPLIGMLSQ